MARIKGLKVLFIGIFFLLVLSGSTCPPEAPTNPDSLSPEWLLRCGDCIATPTPPITVPIVPTINPIIYYQLHEGYCTEADILNDPSCHSSTEFGKIFCDCAINTGSTPTPGGGTITPPQNTPTITPIPQNQMYSIVLNDIDFDYVQVQGDTPVNYSTSTCPNNDIFMGWAIDAQFTLYDGGQGYSQMRFNLADVVDGGGDYIYREYFSGTKNWNKCFSASYGGQSTVQIGGVNYHPCEYLFPTFEVFQSYGYINLYGGGATKPLTSFSAYRQRAVGDGLLYGMCFGIPPSIEPTATPTATMLPEELYCSQYEYVDTSPVVVAPNIGMENGTCFTIIPAFSMDTPAVGTIIESLRIEWQAFKLCPVWVSLSPMSIFDIVIPMELLIIPFVIFLITMIMRL